MKRFLYQIRQTIATLTLTAVAATLAAAPASAQLSALKNAPRPAENVTPPAGEMPAAVSPLVGAWQGGVEGPQQRMMLQMMVMADGSYKARIITEIAPGPKGPTEPAVNAFGGQWKVEGNVFVTNIAADNSIERTEFDLRGDTLVLKGMAPDGSDLTLQRVHLNAGPNNGPGPNAGPDSAPTNPNGRPLTGPLSDNPKIPGLGPNGPNPQPEKVAPAPAPIVGTWYGSGMVSGMQMSCEVNIRPNGTYFSKISLRHADESNNITEEGTWKLRGRKIVFEAEEESTYIPFKVEGDVLILDYSEEEGIIAILSRTPGQGQIRQIEEDYGY